MLILSAVGATSVSSTVSTSCSPWEQRRLVHVGFAPPPTPFSDPDQYMYLFVVKSSVFTFDVQGTVECWDPRSGSCVGEMTLPADTQGETGNR